MWRQRWRPMQKWVLQLGVHCYQWLLGLLLSPQCFFGEGHHPQAGVDELMATDDSAVAVADGAVDLCKGYRASGVAHGDNRE